MIDDLRGCSLKQQLKNDFHTVAIKEIETETDRHTHTERDRKRIKNIESNSSENN